MPGRDAQLGRLLLRADVERILEAQNMIGGVGDRARAPEPALRSQATLRALQRGERRVFARSRFKKNSAAWDRRKRRKGLSPKRMQASGLLRLILEGGGSVSGNSVVQFSAFRGELRFGLRGGRTIVYYARILADRDRSRRVVKVDQPARIDIVDIVAGYVFDGRLA